ATATARTYTLSLHDALPILFEVAPGSRTGIHHHGEQETIAYVLSGICEIRWGERGDSVARAKAGDFIHVPAFLSHMEINPSRERSEEHTSELQSLAYLVCRL